MQESKQNIAKVVSVVKMAENFKCFQSLSWGRPKCLDIFWVMAYVYISLFWRSMLEVCQMLNKYLYLCKKKMGLAGSQKLGVTLELR